jgi:hypothetical protein
MPAHASSSAPTSQVSVLNEDFENGAPGWTFSGFWHVQDHPESISVKSPDINPNLVTLPDPGQLPSAVSGTHAAWFGEAATGTYCGSDFNSVPQHPKDGCYSSRSYSGDMISPSFSLASASAAQLQFQSWWEIEAINPSAYDLMQVYYSTDGGSTWTFTKQLNPASDPVNRTTDQSYSDNGFKLPASWQQNTP